MNFLKKKAERFEKLARMAFKSKEYTYTVFLLEQALQLYIKHILYKVFEDFPKTHNLLVLFKELVEIDKKAEEFLNEHRVIIDILQDAYIGARYTETEYGKETAEECFKLLENFKAVFEKWL